MGFFKETHEVFEFDENQYKDLIYSQWLLYIRKGILGLELYNPELNTWGSASTKGAWIFVYFLLENQIQNQNILEINFNEETRKIQILLDK